MAARRLGKATVESSVLFLCDMQERFRGAIQYYPQVISVAGRMLKGAQALEIPVIVTEQYPQGLGHIVSELDVSRYPIFTKTKFSMLIPEVEKHLKTMPNKKSVILCGIETQVCIFQTVLDLVEKDFDVHIIADAVSSRNMVDRMFALQRCKDAGAFITTSESMLLMLCKDASNPKFKVVQNLIRDLAPDSGLLKHGIDSGMPV